MPRIRQQILRVLSADAAKIARENSQNRKTNSSKSLLWRTPTELKLERQKIFRQTRSMGWSRI